HAGPQVILTNNRSQSRDETLCQLAFRSFLSRELVACGAELLVRVSVDDRDVGRLQTFDCSRDQPLNRYRLFAGKTTRSKLQRHGTLGAAVTIEKHRFGRHHQVHSRALYATERHDRSFQFAFKSALVIDLLVEFGLSP